MDQLKRQTALLTKRMEELTNLISGSLSMAGRSSASEVLEPDLANPFPRPSVFRSLAWPAAPDWAPLVPLEGIPLYQSMLARPNASSAMGSAMHELPFLYSMLSYTHDVAFNLRACQRQFMDEDEFPAHKFEVAMYALDKVVKLGCKRYAELQVMVDHGAQTASLLHLQNFGPSGPVSVLDAGDRSLLIDVKKQEMKEAKKKLLQGQAKPKGYRGNSKGSGDGGAAAPAASATS